MWESIRRWIPMENCRDGYLYRILARNADYGIYNEKHKGFLISRFKFSDNYTFTEDHWDTGAPHGTVKPLMEIGKAPKGMTEAETLEYLNRIDLS